MNACTVHVGACVCACVNVSACVRVSAHVHTCVCVLGQSQCCESPPFPPTLPIGVVERLSCIEGKVDDLQHKQDSQTTAIQDLRHEQDSLSQRIQEVETRSRGV